MFHLLENHIQDVFHAQIQARFGVDLPITLEQPRQAGFGDLAVPSAFQLARQLRQPPKKIAATNTMLSPSTTRMGRCMPIK